MADEFDLKPTSRGEEFLDVILRSLGGDTPDIPQPAWRYEEYLAAIANAIQNGGGGSSGGGVLAVTVTDGTLDKTWQEIHDASFAVVKDGPNTDFVFNVDVEVMISGDKEYVVRTAGSSTAKTDSPDGYPVLVNE